MLSGGMVTTNIIMVNNTNHGLTIGNPVYLVFTTGGAANGPYQVMWSTNNNWFAVMTADTQALSGTGLIPKLTGGGFVITNRINFTYSTAVPCCSWPASYPGSGNFDSPGFMLNATLAGTRTPLRTVQPAYDGLSRLTGAPESPGSNFGYAYDLAGNRTSVAVNGATQVSYNYDP